MFRTTNSTVEVIQIDTVSNGCEDCGTKYANVFTQICVYIIFTGLCQTIGVFGVGTNIVNIICFVKQGFKDPVNVSLLGLAVADLGSIVAILWTNICVTPAFSELDLPFDPVELQHYTTAQLHATFTRISAWITAVIAIERCLCITVPLKVKNWVTPRRVTWVNIAIFALFLPSVAPLFIANRLDFKFFAAKNKTLLGIVHIAGSEHMEYLSYAINNAVVPFSAFIVISTCTVILVVKLHIATKWRNMSANIAQSDSATSRNQKVAKMVVMIAVLYIVCFIPLCLLFVVMSLDPRLSIDGEFKHILVTVGGSCVVLEMVNSSSNIFIYYRMSTKYRTILGSLFTRKK